MQHKAERYYRGQSTWDVVATEAATDIVQYKAFSRDNRLFLPLFDTSLKLYTERKNKFVVDITHAAHVLWAPPGQCACSSEKNGVFYTVTYLRKNSPDNAWRLTGSRASRQQIAPVCHDDHTLAKNAVIHGTFTVHHIPVMLGYAHWYAASDTSQRQLPGTEAGPEAFSTRTHNTKIIIAVTIPSRSTRRNHPDSRPTADNGDETVVGHR